MTPSHSLPVTILPLAIPLTFYNSYQMLLTFLIRKHMYSYISENNFEPANQIIVPTGYKVFLTHRKIPDACSS